MKPAMLSDADSFPEAKQLSAVTSFDTANPAASETAFISVSA